MKKFHPNDLLWAIYRSPKDEELWKELHRQARDVRHWLEIQREEPEGVPPEEEEAEVGPEVTARIYAALAPAEKVVEKSLGTEETLLEESEREDREIGRAFKNELLAGLSPRLTDLEHYFRKAPIIPENEQKDLMKTTDVQVALPEVIPLTRHGLSPVRILYAAKGLVSLAERLMRHKRMAPGPAFLLLGPGQGSAPEGFPVLPPQELDEETALASRCGLATASVLQQWLVEVAQFKPYLFPNGVADIAGRNIVVRPQPDQKMSLAQRWGFPRKKG